MKAEIKGAEGLKWGWGRSVATGVLVLTLAAGANTASADIMGGDDVNGSDPIAHSTVALYRQVGNEGMLCTATLIGNDVAVTAAHCVEDGIDHMAVILGANIADQAHREVIRVVDAEVSPERKMHHAGNQDLGDIALVRLEGKLPKGFHKAPFPPKTFKLQKGDSVVLAGYGITNATTHEGSGTLRKTTVTVADPAFGKTEILFQQSQGHGACHGDSGGPAFVERNGKTYLLGVTSRGYPETAPDDCRHESVYTNVEAYREWITSTAQSMSHAVGSEEK